MHIYIRTLPYKNMFAAHLFLEILRATAYLASITRSVLYAIWWWKEYKQNG